LKKQYGNAARLRRRKVAGLAQGSKAATGLPGIRQMRAQTRRERGETVQYPKYPIERQTLNYHPH